MNYFQIIASQHSKRESSTVPSNYQHILDRICICLLHHIKSGSDTDIYILFPLLTLQRSKKL